MKTTKQKLGKVKIPILPRDSKDVQLIFAFKRGDPNYAEIIQVLLVPGEIYYSLIRKNKINVLLDHGVDESNDKRLYFALSKYMKNLTIKLEEVIPF